MSRIKCKLIYVLSSVPPDVTIDSKKIHDGAKLTCRPSGNPRNYTFYPWKHTTKYGEQIQSLNGTPNGIITIPRKTETTNAFWNDGIYVCVVSNGVLGTLGEIHQEGKYEVRYEGIANRYSVNSIVYCKYSEILCFNEHK